VSIQFADDRATLIRFQGWTRADVLFALQCDDEPLRFLKYRCAQNVRYRSENQSFPSNYAVWNHVLATALGVSAHATFDDVVAQGGADLLVQVCRERPGRFAFTPLCFAMLQKTCVELVPVQAAVINCAIVPVCEGCPDVYPWVCFPVGESCVPVVCMLRLLDQECANAAWEDSLCGLFFEPTRTLDGYSRWLWLVRDVARLHGLGPRGKALFSSTAESFQATFPILEPCAKGEDALLDLGECLGWCGDPASNYFFPWTCVRSAWIQAVIRSGITQFYCT
jgi:hypothetical protein